HRLTWVGPRVPSFLRRRLAAKDSTTEREMLKLVISDDEGKTTVVPLVRDEITIGRKEGNTIRLTERNVSRKHAKLRKVNGGFMLEDLSSYNGVKVNGKKIAAEIALKPGDQVLIGD